MEKKFGVIEEPLAIVKDNGKMVRGVIFRPDQAGEKFPTVIFSHGFGSNYHEIIHHGSGYAESGIVCVMFDFCGGGEESTSDGTMLEMTVLTEAEDLEAVMDSILDQPYVNNDALYLQGESQGGFVYAIVGYRRKEDTKGLILWYPAFIIPDDARERSKTGITTVFGHELSADFDKVAKNIDVNKLQHDFGKPVLLIHGDKDPCVPIEYSRTAAANYGYATLREIKGAGHGFDGEDSNNAREMSIAFVKIYENVANLNLD